LPAVASLPGAISGSGHSERKEIGRACCSASV
jgi:hypothetical protein